MMKKTGMYKHPITKEKIFTYRVKAPKDPAGKKEEYQECKFLMACSFIKQGIEVDKIIVEGCDATFIDTSTFVRIEFREQDTVFLTHSFKQEDVYAPTREAPAKASSERKQLLD